MIENGRSSIFIIDHRSPEAMIINWLTFKQDRHKTSDQGGISKTHMSF